jgi:HD-GYP domain-containing protein (c-di-GMP phosphodiesterase class II)
MRSEPNSRAHLRFAVASVVLVAVSATMLIFIMRTLIDRKFEERATITARGLVAAPVRNVLDDASTGERTPDDLLRHADDVTPFVGGEVLAVRVWSGGDLVFSRGAAMPASRIPDGAASQRFDDSAGDGVFAVYTDANGYTIEIDRASGPIDGAATELKNQVTSVIAIVALIAFGMTQAAFWLAMRRWAGQHRRLEFMYNRGQEIRSSLDLDDTCAQITHDGTILAHGQYGFLALFEPDTGDLVLRATYDGINGEDEQHQRAIEEWFLRRAVATKTTVTSTQPSGAYAHMFGGELQTDNQVSLLCVPMSVRDRVIGALAVVRSSSLGGYAQDEIRLVEELADQSVIAVEQALLFAKVRSYADELEMSYDTTLKVLMAALDTKDDATEGHCERVAKLTSHLARQMDVPEVSLIDMERGALLHDVGKIGVPDEVLHKPDELNEGEWEAMRKHPLLAGVMVGKVGFLEGALPILLYHHERFDGNGYPFGLSGDKIPLDARIFAVVDSYDAMTSDRPYRDAMPHEQAMHEIIENSGTQFDPDVVAAFVTMMRDKPQLQARVGHAMSDDHADHDGGYIVPRRRNEDSAA